MPVATIRWEWEEAFDKFGFGDGDGANFTDEVAAALQCEYGCECSCETWGMHNFMIMGILDKDGKCPYKRKPWVEGFAGGEPETVDGKVVVKVSNPRSKDNGWSVGYANPRDYLPDDWIVFLDRRFPRIKARAKKPGGKRKRKKT